MRKIPRAADQVTIIYQFIILLIILLNYPVIQYAAAFAVFHILLILLLIYLTYLGDSTIIRWLKAWNPVIIIPINFLQLHFFVHSINPKDIDPILIQMDYQIFGVHPTVWLEKISTPLLTEYLQIIYSSFYFLPIILAYFLYRQKRIADFDFIAFVVVFGFYISYIGYFIFPAIGPRFTIDHLQSVPVSGFWLTEHIRSTLDYLENVQRDAFPSGHTELTILTMIYAYKLQRKYFYVLLIVGTSLIISTIYLRYHYVVDVAAGAVLALVVYFSSPPVYRLLNNLKIKLSKNYAVKKIGLPD